MAKKTKYLVTDILPQFLIIVFFGITFLFLMINMYGYKTHYTGKAIQDAVKIIYPTDIQYLKDGIDPNHADIETLCLLPGVGKVTAQAFHDELNLNGPFYYPEDILAVKGIGEKKLANIRDLICLK